jgi:hypothetical protein
MDLHASGDTSDGGQVFLAHSCLPGSFRLSGSGKKRRKLELQRDAQLEHMENPAQTPTDPHRLE